MWLYMVNFRPNIFQFIELINSTWKSKTLLFAAKFDTTAVTGSGYPNNNFGLASSSSVSSKMSVNSNTGGSSKMLPNIPPGVASMIPQYMIGAGTGGLFFYIFAQVS